MFVSSLLSSSGWCLECGGGTVFVIWGIQFIRGCGGMPSRCLPSQCVILSLTSIVMASLRSGNWQSWASSRCAETIPDLDTDPSSTPISEAEIGLHQRSACPPSCWEIPSKYFTCVPRGLIQDNMQVDRAGVWAWQV